ncbi:hypothetical protein, partial [Pseudomonas sp. GL-R-19]|uniref:hypothetical protein n=1 Tax=Pseudomonas sp. GL-R-19 TaxID=2832391 RepID=UPI001CBE16F7
EKPQPTVTRLGTQGAQAGHAVGDGWIIFRAKTMGYFLFDKSWRSLRSFDLRHPPQISGKKNPRQLMDAWDLKMHKPWW